MAGQMVHVEIPAGDTSSAKEFYTGMFGWSWQGFEGSPHGVQHDAVHRGHGRRDLPERRSAAPACTSTSTTSTPGRRG